MVAPNSFKAQTLLAPISQTVRILTGVTNLPQVQYNLVNPTCGTKVPTDY
jgi:hypothetical protein